jgi:hypothetical protein
MPSTNIVMLQVVAKGLGELKDDMAFNLKHIKAVEAMI